jgi:hypothetical protein
MKRRTPTVIRPVRDREPSKYAVQRITVVLSPETIERLRAAAYWTPGETVTHLVERGTLAEIARLERKRGEVFPCVGGSVRRGRPITPR